MEYKTVDEQNEFFIEIIKKSEELMSILDFLYELKVPNFYIVAGSVFQTIWNYYDNKPLTSDLKDIDIIYCDHKNLTKDDEEKLENMIAEHFRNLNYEFDIHNEARMHLWKKENENKSIDEYKNSEDAISRFIATIQSIGITKENDKIKVYAPYGLNDIFSKTIRPIKHKSNSKELYDKKVASWSKRFNNLNIIEW